MSFNILFFAFPLNWSKESLLNKAEISYEKKHQVSGTSSENQGSEHKGETIETKSSTENAEATESSEHLNNLPMFDIVAFPSICSTRVHHLALILTSYILSVIKTWFPLFYLIKSAELHEVMS